MTENQRPTVAGLKLELDKLRTQFIHHLEATKWLEEHSRDKRGVSNAHRKVAELQAELGNIKAAIERLESRQTPVATPPLDPVIQKALTDEMKRLDARLSDLFGQLASADADLQNQIDDLRTEVAGHATRLTAAEGRLDDHDADIAEVRGAHSRLTHRVFNLESLRDHIPWGRIVIGGIIGVVAFLVWNAIEFRQVVNLPDGSTVTVTYWAETVWAAILAGLAAFGLVLGISLLFARRSRAQGQNQHQTQAAHHAPPVPDPAPAAPAPIVVNASQQAPNTAPTRVLPTQGAGIGTR